MYNWTPSTKKTQAEGVFINEFLNILARNNINVSITPSEKRKRRNTYQFILWGLGSDNWHGHLLKKIIIDQYFL